MSLAIALFAATAISTVAADTTEQTAILDEVVVTERALDKLKSTQMGMQTLSKERIKNVPVLFGEADVIKALQLQPGVSAGSEGFAGMYVRGGNNDENLFIVDSNPIYQISHLGGLFSPFNVEAIEKLDFYKSSFPARYGGRLSSVVDISTSDGDTTSYHGSASIGLLSGNLNFSGPIVKGQSSFNISLRRSWLELITVPTLAIMNATGDNYDNNTIGGYSFTDLNIKLSHWFKHDSKLSLNVYYGADRLKIGEENIGESGGKDVVVGKDLNRLNWGNFVASLGWNHRINSRLRLDATASFTHFFSLLNHATDDFSYPEDKDRIHEYTHTENINRISDYSLNARFLYSPIESHMIRFGTGYTYHNFTPEKSSIKSSSMTEKIVDKRIAANEFFLFIEDDFTLADWMSVNGGLRFSLFEAQRKTHASLEPRISTNFRVSPSLSFKAGYSRMSQCVQQVSNNYISLPTDFWMPITRNLKPLVSDQISVGAYFRLKDEYTFSVEGYYKWMKNLLEYRDNYNLLPPSASWEEKLTSGSGTSYGFDFTAEKDFGRVTGFIGYGLMWTDRTFAELNQGKTFPAKYDNRHKINIHFNYKISDKIDINCGWTFMSGNRATIAFENYQEIGDAGFDPSITPSNPYDDEWGVAYYSAKNNYRLPDYHRLDLGLNLRHTTKRGHVGTWSFGIYNAYCNMNPIVIQRDNQRQTSEGTPLSPRFRSLSIFPIIPSVSYTYKF